jgi:NAD-dependent deacetylase
MDHQKTLFITGAGISVESGIQAFRGKNGIWNENPMEMATFAKFESKPADFLTWYYHRFVSCKDALPNEAHEILAQQKVKVITQNIDNLHKKAMHPSEFLIEIHGNIYYKRKINDTSINDLIIAHWEQLDENNLQKELFREFKIANNGTINYQKSFRPHILLFDEYYTALYQYELAQDWIKESDTVVFIGTSNSVGITTTTLEIAYMNKKKIIVVDPNPSPSFVLPGIEIFKQTAIEFCKHFF